MTTGPQEPQPGSAAWQPAPGAPAAQPAPGSPAYQPVPAYQATPGYPGGGLQPQVPYPVAPVVAPKNGAIGVILSFFIPGLGSMVNGSVGLGAIILATYAIGWVLTLVIIGFPILFGAWIWGMVDGYLSAERWNRAHGIIGA